MNQYEIGKRTKFFSHFSDLFLSICQLQVLNTASGVAESGPSFTVFYEWIGQAFLSRESLYTPQACRNSYSCTAVYGILIPRRAPL